MAAATTERGQATATHHLGDPFGAYLRALSQPVAGLGATDNDRPGDRLLQILLKGPADIEMLPAELGISDAALDILLSLLQRGHFVDIIYPQVSLTSEGEVIASRAYDQPLD